MGATSQHIKEDDETQSQGKNIFSGMTSREVVDRNISLNKSSIL